MQGQAFSAALAARSAPAPHGIASVQLKTAENSANPASLVLGCARRCLAALRGTQLEKVASGTAAAAALVVNRALAPSPPPHHFECFFARGLASAGLLVEQLPAQGIGLVVGCRSGSLE